MPTYMTNLTSLFVSAFTNKLSVFTYVNMNIYIYK